MLTSKDQGALLTEIIREDLADHTLDRRNAMVHTFKLKLGLSIVGHGG
jgi:hypothetical protein